MFKMKLALGAISLVALSACAGPDQGVWWVELEVANDGACSQSVAHNFIGASVPEEAVDEDPWIREQEDGASPAGFFALVTQDADGLLWTAEGQVLRGEKSSEGWSLEGEHFESEDRSDSHPDGYTFSSQVMNTVTNRLELTQDRDTLSGSWTLVNFAEADYDESDDWSAELGQGTQIPASSYLLLEDGTPATNLFDFEDCSSAPCSLSVEATCSVSASMVAVRTELDAQDFEGISDAGFEAGL